MSRKISTIPGAPLFRSVLSIVIILVCILYFLSYTEKLSENVEDIARQRVVIQINNALSMMLYDYTIKGKQFELSRYDGGNPFDVLALYGVVPEIYRGVLTDLPNNPQPGWYYLENLKQVALVTQTGRSSYFAMNYSLPVNESVGQLLFHAVNSAG